MLVRGAAIATALEGQQLAKGGTSVLPGVPPPEPQQLVRRGISVLPDVPPPEPLRPSIWVKTSALQWMSGRKEWQSLRLLGKSDLLLMQSLP